MFLEEFTAGSLPPVDPTLHNNLNLATHFLGGNSPTFSPFVILVGEAKGVIYISRFILTDYFLTRKMDLISD